MNRKLVIFTFLLIFIFFELNSVTIETKSGKVFESVTIGEETETTLEFIDSHGIITRIRKDSIKKISDDKPLGAPEESADESIPVPMPAQPKKSDLPEHSILLNQSLSNDGAFQGASLFGERQSRRNNESYKSFSQAWFLTSSVDLLGLPKELQISLTALNPLVDRTNTDSDLFYQSTPGGANQNQLVTKSINSGTLQYDPNQVKPRKEKNALTDYLFSRINYEHTTKLGSFGVGFLFINVNDPTYVMRGYYTVTWRPPFLAYLNPVFSINNKMLSEYGGIFQGDHNYRLSFGHEFFKEKIIRITPSLVIGYQDVNNNQNMKKGFSDISPRLQFNLSNYFIAFNYMYRATPALADTKYYTPDIGVYPDSNQNDGKSVDPSKAYGYKNTFITDTIGANSPNELVRYYLTDRYQQQHIVRGIFFFNIGYTVRI